MTLDEWTIKHNRVVRRHSYGPNKVATWLPDDFRVGNKEEREARIALFSLSDYLVSSVTGGTIWLVKRPLIEDQT